MLVWILLLGYGIFSGPNPNYHPIRRYDLANGDDYVIIKPGRSVPSFGIPEHILFVERPTDCDFDSSPMGTKACHYEEVAAGDNYYWEKHKEP